jgi:hypothetical protein
MFLVLLLMNIRIKRSELAAVSLEFSGCPQRKNLLIAQSSTLRLMVYCNPVILPGHRYLEGHPNGR